MSRFARTNDDACLYLADHAELARHHDAAVGLSRGTARHDTSSSETTARRAVRHHAAAAVAVAS